MKNLLILNIEDNFDKARKISQKINKKNLEILYLNNNLFIKNLKYSLLDDLFKPEYASKIDQAARKLAKSWHNSIKDDLKYDDLVLSELVENKFLKIWPILLKIEILTKFIKEEKPKEIFIITEYEEDIKLLKEISKDIKLNCFFFRKSNKKSINLKLKNFSYKIIAKFQNYLFKIYIKKNKTKKGILVLGNLRQLLPLFKKLKENPNNMVIRAGENIGRGLFTKNCDCYITFKEFYDKDIESKIKSERINLINKWGKIKLNKKLRESLKYKLNLFDILEPNLKEIFFKDFIDLIKYIEIMKKIKEKVDIVVTHNDVIAFEKTVVRTANKLNIPTITMIEGFLSLKKIRSGTQYIPFSSKIMAMHSISQKELVIKKYRILKERLIIMGHPMFDRYYNDKPIEKKELYKRHNIPLNKKLILYVAERYNNKNKYESSIWSAYTKKQYLSIYEELFKGIKEVQDEVFLIIKKHPSEVMDDAIIEAIAKKQGIKNCIILKDLDLYGAINASSAIILRLSTIGLEAMMLKRPVIVMDTNFDTNDNVGYTEFNAALHAKKPGDLGKLLKNLLHNEVLQNSLDRNMERFVNYNYISDGNASLRMAKLINETIKTKT
ncbi:MAG: CDP-glycerol glycerophosphotransferase family protein [Nanoarchaeota archaeon]